MADKNKCAEQYYTPPPKLGKWEGFSIFMWNSETSQFMGRTGSSWAKILLFYLIFYIGLVGYFSAMVAVFYTTIDYQIPKWQLDQSLIGNNPGLGFRPMPPDTNVESTLIWYRGNDGSNYKYWTEELDKFLAPYDKSQTTGSINSNNCAYGKPPLNDGEVCAVEIEDWTPCIKAEEYNYPKSAPCIFLKLNKIYNWNPIFYNDSSTVPENMPNDLKDYIKKHPQEGETVWISCEGENPADVENMGAIRYIPRRGFPGYYFPFKKQDGYLSPLVAINFERPIPGVLINIECKAWAKNIHHDRHERRGSVHFELMID